MLPLGRSLLALGLAASPALAQRPASSSLPRAPLPPALARGAAPLASAAPRYADLGYPAALPKPVLIGLLQRVVDRLYMKAFRHLGDERDFDHGHLLFDASGLPLAILYHTQELALHEPRGSGYGYLDPDGRNWIQWLSDGRIENARRYLRSSYPNTATWDWFRVEQLPGLEENHTILDKMLDPALVGLDASKTKQWVFTRVPCGPEASAPDSRDIRVFLPTKEAVCLSLSMS